MNQSSEEGTTIYNPSPIKKTPRSKIQDNINDNAPYSNSFINSMANLEKRMKTCDSVYRLAVEANNIRAREHQEQVKQMRFALEQIDARITNIENTFENIPHIVHQLIEEQYATTNPDREKEQYLQQFQESLELQLNHLQELLDAQNEYDNKMIKKINRDILLLKGSAKNETNYDETETQLHEVQKEQASLLESLNQIKKEREHQFK